VRGITAFTGLNGSGKTLAAMVRIIEPSIALGRPILSNTPIFASPDDSDLSWEERELHPLYVPLVSWRQLNARLANTTIFLDEISSMFDSRESSKMPTQLVSRFQQLRKDDNVLCWTAPNWERCDKALRGPTSQVWLCTGHWEKKVDGKMWGQNRVFKWRCYDKTKFEEFSLSQAQSDQKGTLKAEFRIRYRRNKHKTQFLYDTLAPVNLLDHLDQGGTCIDCGGSRPKPKCQCKGGVAYGRGEILTLADMQADAVRFNPEPPVLRPVDEPSCADHPLSALA